MTGYGLDDLRSIPGRGKRFVSIPQRLDWLWGPLRLLYNAYRGLFHRGLGGWGVKLITHIYLVPRSRMMEIYLHYPYVFMA
jgi:hypothetical protein